jgi:XapX domain-containing protein
VDLEETSKIKNAASLPSVSSIVIALATGIAVGAVFGFAKLPSPAPPLLGLISLLGMLKGQWAWPLLQHLIPAILKQRTCSAAAESVVTEVPVSLTRFGRHNEPSNSHSALLWYTRLPAL